MELSTILGGSGIVEFCVLFRTGRDRVYPALRMATRQDDYDIWLGTDHDHPWTAYRRHAGSANYLYLDGHAVSRDLRQWPSPDMYPDKVVLTDDGSYP